MSATQAMAARLTEIAGRLDGGYYNSDYWDGNDDIRFLIAQLQQAEQARDTAHAVLNGLVMAVGNKYPGETRYQTALRYIRHAETREGGVGQAMKPAPAQETERGR